MTAAYHQSRDETAALLKQVIAAMGQHDAPFDPRSYAVWYEHLLGINPGLSRALQALLKQQPRLGAADIERLYGQHILPPKEEDVRLTEDAVQEVMAAMARQAAQTGQEARQYGTQLDGFSRALQSPDVPAALPVLSTQLAEVTGGTARMRQAISELERSVEDSRAEVSRLRAALERTRVEAVTDSLSQLLNRKGFDQAMEQMLRSPPAPGRQHALVVLDIDHFKRVNDTYGHAVGDTVIQTVAQVMRKLAQPPSCVPARIGGEEFAVVCRNSLPGQAVQLAQGLAALVRGTTIRQRGTGEPIAKVTVSAGVAHLATGDDAASLLASADAALYRAKHAGRDRVSVA